MIAHNSLTPKYISINCKGQLLSLQTPAVMGILNITPDSFFDGGKFNSIDFAIKQTEKMLNEGASIIDIGGFSSRPGSDSIELQEELDRVIPIIEKVSNMFQDAIISIDTFRAKVALDAVNAGASIVNDISAGDDDPDMVATVAALGVPYVAMHKQGNSKTMQINPKYGDVTTDVMDYFIKKVQLFREAGIKDVIIDPGFGFGKNREHNYSLLKNLAAFKMLDCPILVGMSRKRMINEVLNISSKDALNGTTVVNTIALLNGANILRVHDVKEAVEAVKIVMNVEL